MNCPLCIAEPRTPRLHEDAIVWAALCSSCHVPMVVLKRHTDQPTRAERHHMHTVMIELGAAHWKQAPWLIDEENKSIPDHAHMHARHAPRRFL